MKERGKRERGRERARERERESEREREINRHGQSTSHQPIMEECDAVAWQPKLNEHVEEREERSIEVCIICVWGSRVAAGFF